MKISVDGEISGKYYKVLLLIPFLLVFLLLGLNIKRIKPRVVNALYNLNPLKTTLFSPDDLKLRHQINARVLDYYEFINRNTPKNAKILIPPTAYPWPMTGNVHFSRYFLYPRYLIVGKEKEPGVDLKKENIQYVLTIWGEEENETPGYTHGWPKFSVPAKRIIFKKPTSQLFNYETLIIETDFNPNMDKSDIWGIIEVDGDRL